MGNQESIVNNSSIIFADEIIPKNVLIYNYLIVNINRYTNKYTYIRCLSLDDSKIFMKSYINFIDNSKIHIDSKILVSDWDKIMRLCETKFNNRYNVFRASYWGETSGRISFTNRKTDYRSLVRIYNRENTNVIDLLLDDSKVLRIINPNLSSYMNPNIAFIWDTELY